MRGHYCLGKKEFLKMLRQSPIGDVRLTFKDRLSLELWKMLVNMEVTGFTLECPTCKKKIKVSVRTTKKEIVETLRGSGFY